MSENPLSRPLFEYYLSTLTNRSQEIEFEGFARKLCELEICPNLTSHSGPTGGGDSKVDTETYPVSDTTTLNWYTGVGNKAANERWGFAFSTKKEWVGKVRSDVRKIHGTGRGYKIVYFVSSQFIPDKKRAETEDELTKETGIVVRIHDRNWILDTVFGKGHEKVAREKLKMELVEEKVVKKGAMDLQREEDLQEINKHIQEKISLGKVEQDVVEKAITSVILGRELEKGRTEIDGLFGRAERLAKEYGNEFQQFDVAYQWAWTTFWWHEDYKKVIDLYSEVEVMALKNSNVYHLERLTNLWNLLNIIRRDHGIDDALMAFRTKNLKEKLQTIADNKNASSSSLYARSLLLQIELMECLFAKGNLDPVLKSLKQVVIESKGLIGFPLRPLVELLTENSEVLESSAEYNTLFDTILTVVAKRDGELSSARLLLDRSAKLIEKKHYYEAIQNLGHAIKNLHKYESKNEVVHALYMAGVAYKAVGLYWAARGSFLVAASHATSDFWTNGEINIAQALCYKQLKWLELKLGRIAQALDWHILDFAFRNALIQKGYKPDDLFDQLNNFDLALGILFLRADISSLESLQYLPDTLSEYGLEYSSIALMYALQGKKHLPKEFTGVVSDEEVDDFFSEWASRYSPRHLPATVVNTDRKTVIYESKILGCKIEVTTENGEPYIEVAESLLAAIESLLSTMPLKHAIVSEPLLTITITPSPVGKNLIEHILDNTEDEPHITIRCTNFNPHNVSHEDQRKLIDSIFDILVSATASIMIFKDPEKDLKEMIVEERAPDRALNFTGSFVTLGNVLGHKPKIKTSDWKGDGKKKYELSRVTPVKFKEIKKTNEKKEEAPDPDVDPFATASHADIGMLSIIRMRLWDAAKWQGLGFAMSPTDEQPPILAIIFENIEAGKKIFSAWKKLFGHRDEKEQVRVSIVEGIDKKNPNYYRAGISANAQKDSPLTKGMKFFTSPTRIHTMTPASLKNLERFKKAYEKFGCYWLAPALAKDGKPEILTDFTLLKREIHFRRPEEIGENEIDRPLRGSDG